LLVKLLSLRQLGINSMARGASITQPIQVKNSAILDKMC
jgi:hypothetical protein